MEENIVIYDWISITSKIHYPQDLISQMGLDYKLFQLISGARGYHDRLYFQGISIHYNGREDMGIWLEMSGQGCRAFESFGSGDYSFLFSEVIQNPKQMNITRLDIAFDDHSGLLDIDTIFHDTENQEYISKFNYWEVIKSAKGCTVQVGSPKSSCLVRIYDKAAERKCSSDVHWVRCEVQLRDDRCLNFITELELAKGDVGKVYSGVVLNYLRYVDPDPEDSNRWRWPLKGYWADFLYQATKISLFTKPGTEYNLERCENYVFNQAGNAIDCLIDIHGTDGFLKKLHERSSKSNPKYTNLKNMFRGKKNV